MRFDVRDPGILGGVFLLLNRLNQEIEAAEIGIAVDYGLRLLRQQNIQLADSLQETALQPIFHVAESDPRNPQGGNPALPMSRS